ncbi:MAG: helix-turn-helix transcriptional regulator [Lachnospiraceae bacterium]|nr:helix-turn-helix transcriptional regulator [Lachnospiraceae bacterium]
MDQVRIGEFIAKTRKEKGYTQKELAEKVRLSDKAVSKWERGNSMPDISVMMDLCEVLDLDINEDLNRD